MTARARAVWMRPPALSSMVLAEITMGSMAARPWRWGSRASKCQDIQAVAAMVVVPSHLTEPYLRADLGRDAGELRVGRKGAQIIHSLQQRGSGRAALGTVLLSEVSVQRLAGQ